MKDKLEIIFWKIARRLIIRGYGEPCKDYDELCGQCEAGKMVKWIDSHIELLRM